MSKKIIPADLMRSEGGKTARPIVAAVDGTNGWRIGTEYEKDYEWEMEPEALDAPLIDFDKPINLRLFIMRKISKATEAQLNETGKKWSVRDGYITIQAVEVQYAADYANLVNS